jgi:hypothetical protein
MRDLAFGCAPHYLVMVFAFYGCYFGGRDFSMPRLGRGIKDGSLKGQTLP